MSHSEPAKKTVSVQDKAREAEELWWNRRRTLKRSLRRSLRRSLKRSSLFIAEHPAPHSSTSGASAART